MKDFFEHTITENNIIYAKKGGIPNVGHSTNPNFYLLCYDFNSNIGYIEKKGKKLWRLYIRTENLLKTYWNGKTDKFYYDDDSFQKCVDKLQELTGQSIKILSGKDI